MLLRFFILAFAFLLSCTSEERDSVCDEKSVKYNGGCVGNVLPSSSSVWTGPIYDKPITYMGESYRTVKVGTQVWLDRNLNYYVEGSRCYRDGSVNCETYGRMYSWAAAMDLDASCNQKSCYGQIQARHRGICPDGWHIPSNTEWDALKNTVGSSSTALKAESGWGLYNNNGGGNNKYGFSALPGGYYDNNLRSFDYIYTEGYWWSSSEYNVDRAYYWYMLESDDSFNYEFSKDKVDLFYVRCMRN